jgi:hypothetical protein
VTSARGSLAVVGCGIRPGLQTTPESLALVDSASKCFHLLADPLGEAWLKARRPDSESLARCYRDGRSRLDSYAEMTEIVLAAVRSGETVCVVFYGHPGVFVRPAHDAVRRARNEGYDATMLPGISAEDMLFAEVGLDPAERGCQSHAAEDFVLEGRHFDPCSALVLWQVGVLGEDRHRSQGYRSTGVSILLEALLRDYPASHEIVIYEANELPLGPPSIHRLALDGLPSARLSVRSTLLVPPLAARPRDEALAERLARLLGTG